MKIYLTDVKEIRNLDADEDYICMWDENVCYDADTDAYTMNNDQFEWWKELLERKAHCDEYDLGMRVSQYERLLTEELKERK